MNRLEQAHDYFQIGAGCHDFAPAEAMEHYRQAIFLWPQHAPAHYNLGVLLLAEGRTNEGREHIFKAAQADPHNEQFQKRCDELLAQRNRSIAKAQEAQAELDAKIDESRRGDDELRDAEADLRARQQDEQAEDTAKKTVRPRGRNLRLEALLDQALRGNWLDVEYSYDALPSDTAMLTRGRYATMAALAHLVAGRRGLRTSLPVVPVGRARDEAIRRIPVIADLIADLRKLEESDDIDHLSTAKRLTRQGDALHEQPNEAIAKYRAALAIAPDHAPAYFGLFVVERENGRHLEAASHLANAIHFSPGNRVFLYYRQSWLEADPEVARFFPRTDGGRVSSQPTPVEHGLSAAVHVPENVRGRVEELPLHDPTAVRGRVDALLENQQHDELLTLAHSLQTQPPSMAGDSADIVRTSLLVVEHAASLAHIDLALGLLLGAANALNQAGRGGRFRLIQTEVCIDRIVGM